ncbi:class I SAM-dependent methyltransferase [Nakamurella sp.]|uniref:class I SAM-dependent methyltransferase n=1 Tax=Nakamurella sp. TaxID=1869182 RepID=UPI003B3A1694
MQQQVTWGGRSFAFWYPGMMARIDRRGQSALRREQLAAAGGRVLEIGAGSGLSLPHYPADLDELVLLEPNPAFHQALAPAAARLPFPTRVIAADAHDLPFEDGSFDTVTASLVFCSVDDPAGMLAEVHRVLAPGGRFLFHEHVRGGPVRGPVQDLLTPLQRRLADGCRPNRDFVATLAGSPLHLVTIHHRRMPTRIPTLVPLVLGAAERRPEPPASATSR